MSTATSSSSGRILGYFFFRDLGDGCLGSKFGNTVNLRLLTESATRTPDAQPDPSDRFIGRYVSTWLDGNNENPIENNQSLLTIDRKPQQYRSVPAHLEGTTGAANHSLLWRGHAVWNGPGRQLLGSCCSSLFIAPPSAVAHPETKLSGIGRSVQD